MDEATSETLPATQLGTDDLHNTASRSTAGRGSADVLALTVSPEVRAARDQFRRDFPQLLAHRATYPAEKWVAYHGETRLGFGATKSELVQMCLARGLRVGEFLVLGIDPASVDDAR
jgi:hypothetical protein